MPAKNKKISKETLNRIFFEWNKNPDLKLSELGQMFSVSKLIVSRAISMGLKERRLNAKM